MFNRAALNRLVLALAPSHEARGIAPGTFPDLMRAGPCIVWEGASDKTIFGDARVNHAFRAWHDSAHKAGQFDFTLAGEIATAGLQKAQVRLRYPSAPNWVYRLIDAEVTEQAIYYAAHGFFPLDQAAFVMERIGNV